MRCWRWLPFAEDYVSLVHDLDRAEIACLARGYADQQRRRAADWLPHEPAAAWPTGTGATPVQKSIATLATELEGCARI